MLKCPNCGREIAEGDNLCKYCGTKLADLHQNQASAGSSRESDVEKAVVNRLDGIKNKDEGTIRAVIDERYSKFDDWPPFRRQEATEALENEFGSFKVLSGYTYELKDFHANIFGDVAITTFQIHYQGVIRDKPFDINSRVTSVLNKQDSVWKVVHEHFSRFPEETQQQLTALQLSRSPPSPSHPPGRDRARTYAVLGLISAALGLLVIPEVLCSLTIILGAYSWRNRQGNLGLIILIIGIICMIVGIEVTALIL
jgi:ketosteroid isomerase-like protein